MPIPFHSIPEHIRIGVFKKMTLRDFRQFHECSSESYSFVKDLKKIFSITFMDMDVWTEDQPRISLRRGNNRYFKPSDFLIDVPVSVEVKSIHIFCELTSEICEWLTNMFFNRPKFYCHRFQFTKKISCSTVEMNELLSISNARECNFDPYIAIDYLRIPVVKNLEYVAAESVLNDEDFLSLKVPKFHLENTNISSHAINLFLKEWLNGERPLEYGSVDNMHDLEEKTCFEGIAITRNFFEKEEVDVIGVNEGKRTMISIDDKYFAFRTEESWIAERNARQQIE